MTRVRTMRADAWTLFSVRRMPQGSAWQPHPGPVAPDETGRRVAFAANSDICAIITIASLAVREPHFAQVMIIQNMIVLTELRSLAEIFLTSHCYRVPRYQRDYCWGKAECEALFADIMDVVKTQKQHHLGDVVMFRTGEQQFDLVDGQQRLTTVFLVTLAAAMKFKKAVDRGEDVDANTDWIRYCHTRLLSTSWATYIGVRLSLNRNNNSYLECLTNDLEFVAPAEHKHENKFIHDALKFFIDAFEPISCQDVVNIIFDMYFYMSLTAVKVASPNVAFNVLEILGHTGPGLEIADLFKNLLMDKCATGRGALELDDMLATIDARWESMVEKVGVSETSNYLRSMEMLHSKGDVIDMKHLYAHVDGRLKGCDAAAVFAGDLERNAHTYNAIRGKESSRWVHQGKDFSDSLDVLVALGLFSVRLPVSMLLAAADNFDPADFKRLAAAVLKITVRYSIACNNPSRDLEKEYACYVERICAKSMNADDIIRDLVNKRFYPTDMEFMEGFSALAVTQRPRALYLLTNMEGEWDRKLIDDLTAEKLVPSSPSPYWKKNFDAVMLPAASRSIGNYYLVNGDGSSKAAKDYEEFIETNKTSRFKVNQRIASYGKWDYKVLQEHRSWLAARAVDAWCIKQEVS